MHCLEYVFLFQRKILLRKKKKKKVSFNLSTLRINKVSIKSINWCYLHNYSDASFCLKFP